MAADHQAVHGGLHGADGEWNGGRRGVFVRGLIRDAGDGGRVVRRSEGLNSSTAGGSYVAIFYSDGNRGCAGLIGGRYKSDGAIRSTAAKDNVRIRHQGRIG